MTEGLTPPSDPSYNRELRDAVMDQAPFYDPNHRCGIVRDRIFHGCLEELRERERVTLEKLKSAEASIDTYREHTKSLQEDAYKLRCFLQEIAKSCNIDSDSTLPHHIVAEVNRLNERRRKIANAASVLWEEHKEYSRGEHGVEGCDSYGTDSEGHQMMQALVDETP